MKALTSHRRLVAAIGVAGVFLVVAMATRGISSRRQGNNKENAQIQKEIEELQTEERKARMRLEEVRRQDACAYDESLLWRLRNPDGAASWCECSCDGQCKCY
jgi:hypothetical protein